MFRGGDMLTNRSCTHVLGRVFVVCCLIACFVPFAAAQTTAAGSGTLTGDVEDEGGAGLPGVTVSAVGPAGNKTAYTDSQGNFQIPNLAPGLYDLTAELSGFITITKTDVQVQAGSNTATFVLKQGGLAETMVVTASKVETP